MERREEEEGEAAVQSEKEEDEDDDEEMEEVEDEEEEEEKEVNAQIPKTKKKGSAVTSSLDKKCVPGIIYLGHIPPRLRPNNLRNMLSVYGEIGRIFLQPEGSTQLLFQLR